MARRHYVAIVEQGRDGFGVFFPDLPGCTSAGDSVAEATRNAEEALAGWIEVTAEHGEPIPAPSAIERLRRLVDAYLGYIEVDTFPGGCFFASVLAEVDMQPGAVRDRLVAFLGDWLARLEDVVREAQAEGAIDPEEDPAQLVFEIEALLLLANAQFVVSRSHDPIGRAHRGIERRLALAAGPGRPAR